MANNRKKRNHKSRSPTISLAIAAGFVPPVVDLWGKRGNPMAFGNEILRIFLGIDYWDMSFDIGRLRWGTLPIVAGILVHKFVGGKLGVNKMMARAGIPFIRI